MEAVAELDDNKLGKNIDAYCDDVNFQQNESMIMDVKHTEKLKQGLDEIRTKDHFGHVVNNHRYCHLDQNLTLPNYAIYFVGEQHDHIKCMHNDNEYSHLYNTYIANDENHGHGVCTTHHQVWQHLQNVRDTGDLRVCLSLLVSVLTDAYEQNSGYNCITDGYEHTSGYNFSTGTHSDDVVFIIFSSKLNSLQLLLATRMQLYLPCCTESNFSTPLLPAAVQLTTTVDRRLLSVICARPPVTHRNGKLDQTREYNSCRLVNNYFYNVRRDGNELADLIERIDTNTTAYCIEISAAKTKLMRNNTNGINAGNRVSGQKLGRVTRFKYMGPVFTDEGSNSEQPRQQ